MTITGLLDGFKGPLVLGMEDVHLRSIANALGVHLVGLAILEHRADDVSVEPQPLDDVPLARDLELLALCVDALDSAVSTTYFVGAAPVFNRGELVQGVTATDFWTSAQPI